MKEYINREAAIQGILNDSCELVFYTKENVIDYLESIPASDVAPVRHRIWIFDHMTGEWSYYSRCSECGHQEFFANDSVEKRHKYCYSCGALMDGKENNI